jgi:hypothetical protein
LSWSRSFPLQTLSLPARILTHFSALTRRASRTLRLHGIRVSHSCLVDRPAFIMLFYKWGLVVCDLARCHGAAVDARFSKSTSFYRADNAKRFASTKRYITSYHPDLDSASWICVNDKGVVIWCSGLQPVHGWCMTWTSPMYGAKYQIVPLCCL